MDKVTGLKVSDQLVAHAPKKQWVIALACLKMLEFSATELITIQL